MTVNLYDNISWTILPVRSRFLFTAIATATATATTAIATLTISNTFSAYFSTSIPKDELLERTIQYEMEVFRRSESRTNYLRRIRLPAKWLEQSSRKPIPPIPTDATVSQNHPMFKPVEEEKPGIPLKLRFTVQRTIFEYLLSIYTCASDEIVRLAQQFETRAFHAAQDRPDYRARVASELEREKKEIELDTVLVVPNNHMIQ